MASERPRSVKVDCVTRAGVRSRGRHLMHFRQLLTRQGPNLAGGGVGAGLLRFLGARDRGRHRLVAEHELQRLESISWPRVRAAR